MSVMRAVVNTDSREPNSSRQHVLPYFASFRLDEITVEDVDRFRRSKVKEGRLSPASINKMISTGSAVLDVAVEYEHIARNPAKGRRRRLKTGSPRRTYLDRPEQITALLDAAGDLDRKGRTRAYRRPLLATLVFAGFRIGEALDLEWRDVDLAKAWLHVRGHEDRRCGAEDQSPGCAARPARCARVRRAGRPGLRDLERQTAFGVERA
jgi:integrase